MREIIVVKWLKNTERIGIPQKISLSWSARFYRYYVSPEFWSKNKLKFNDRMKTSKAIFFSRILENKTCVCFSVTMFFYGLAMIGVKNILFFSCRECHRNNIVTRDQSHRTRLLFLHYTKSWPVSSKWLTDDWIFSNSLTSLLM